MAAARGSRGPRSEHKHARRHQGELAEIAARIFAKAGARSGPELDYGFPETSCISVNDEAVHGVPRQQPHKDGDLGKLDVTAELDGFYADTCVSIPVGTVSNPPCGWPT